MIVRFGIALAALPLAFPQLAHSHGIAGNRYFDGTLTIDNPPSPMKQSYRTAPRDSCCRWSAMRPGHATSSTL